jgi:hypothetical protein
LAGDGTFHKAPRYRVRGNALEGGRKGTMPDLERLSPVVRALRAFPIPETVDALTAELRRIPSSNHTRTYLNGVFEAVTGFPDDLVRDRLAELSADRSFSIKWRRKLRTALEGAEDDLAADDDYW